MAVAVGCSQVWMSSNWNTPSLSSSMGEAKSICSFVCVLRSGVGFCFFLLVRAPELNSINKQPIQANSSKNTHIFLEQWLCCSYENILASVCKQANWMRKMENCDFLSDEISVSFAMKFPVLLPNFSKSRNENLKTEKSEKCWKHEKW